MNGIDFFYKNILKGIHDFMEENKGFLKKFHFHVLNV